MGGGGGGGSIYVLHYATLSTFGVGLWENNHTIINLILLTLIVVVLHIHTFFNCDHVLCHSYGMKLMEKYALVKKILCIFLQKSFILSEFPQCIPGIDFCHS